jgi:uncharacterized protein YprB with RNaseH-like and TPR domain
MLRHTFIHMPGVGPSTERSLWEQGLHSWSDCLTRRASRVCGYATAAKLRTYARESDISLRNGNAAYFDRLLPRTESWRMYGDFRDSAAFIDVETTGSRGQGEITVIGLSDGIRTKVFVKGKNLADFKTEVRKYVLLVTYNGRYFDIPFICNAFGDIFANMAHIDLQYALQRLGYVGGLKEIQEQFGFHREGALGRLDGRYAIWLWEEYEKGNRKALNTLLRYNLEDVVVLQSLAEAVYNESVRRLPVPVAELVPGRKPKIDIPYDEELLRKLGKKPALRSHTQKSLVDRPDDHVLDPGDIGLTPAG